jgi:hypothetical protein
MQFWAGATGAAPPAVTLFESDRERVDGLVDRLPTRRFQTDEQLEAMKPGRMKELLRGFGVSCATMTEKSELLQALLSRRQTSCAVCAEDFAPDAAYRRTLCGHAFHGHCLRSAAICEYDTSRRMPHCPMCRQSLNAPPHAVREAQSEKSSEPKAPKRQRVPSPSSSSGPPSECKTQ